MIMIFLIIILIYLVLIGSFILGFDKVKETILEDIPAKINFSIVIPFRNESKQLPELLASIANINYPKNKFEVILIDDASNDDSLSIIQTYLQANNALNISVLPNERRTGSPKKDAITIAIEHAKHEWIITTDADCIAPKYWLDGFDYFIQNNNAEFIVAPVTYHRVDSFIKRFQLLDFLSLQGATIGGFGIKKPFLCNGANLAYHKTLFNSLNGFEGNTNIASGDDIFLLEKALKIFPEKVNYLKCQKVIVKTMGESSLSSLVSQRVRWAAKTSNYKNIFAFLTGLVIFLTNASLISMLLLSFFGVISAKFLLYIFVIKFSIDFLLLYKSTRFFNQERYLTSYMTSSLLYPFFSIYIVVISLFRGYKWKGRGYRK